MDSRKFVVFVQAEASTKTPSGGSTADRLHKARSRLYRKRIHSFIRLRRQLADVLHVSEGPEELHDVGGARLLEVPQIRHDRGLVLSPHESGLVNWKSTTRGGGGVVFRLRI